MPEKTSLKQRETGVIEVVNLVDETNRILGKDSERIDKLMDICVMLHENVNKFDWVGFYFVESDSTPELVLGPFVGEQTNHTRIPFGTGICGQAAETQETFVVDDVEAESNYLSCGAAVKSEIVVPIIKDDVLIGELDIDSHVKGAINQEDRKVLEEIAELVAGLF